MTSLRATTGKILSKLANLNLAAALTLTVSIFFSYQPLISFGPMSGFNLELSLSQIAGVLFVSTSLGYIYRQRKQLTSSLGNKLFLALCVLSSLSILWSENTSRGIFMSLFLWFIFALVIAVQASYDKLLIHKKIIFNTLLLSTIFVCLFSFWQLIGDALGVSSSLTLLPATYQYAVFGFARPTGFALEPQFLSSLLIIPTLLTACLFLKRKSSKLQIITLILSLSVIATTISRGATFGLIAGLLILILVAKPSSRKIIHLVGILIVSLNLSLVSIGLTAEINNRDTLNGKDSIYRAVNHMSLGRINLQTKPETTTIDQSTSTEEVSSASSENNGYVAESTDSRLLMSEKALELWSRNVSSVIFGIGYGGFGATLNAADSTHSLSSIVNNYYLETLAELGLVGAILFISLLAYLIRQIIKSRAWIFAPILAGFMIQWLFFSGNANILHIWLIIALMLSSKLPKPKKT